MRTWELRRLQFVVHAGAAASTTNQTYTRLEHSLGLLALVAHFAPHDEVARLAALLHDIGHLPFSHTFEGVAGLDHHELGRQRIRELTPLLAEYGMDADEVLGVMDSGTSVLRGRPGSLKLDHLESLSVPTRAALPRYRLRRRRSDRIHGEPAGGTTRITLALCGSHRLRTEGFLVPGTSFTSPASRWRWFGHARATKRKRSPR
ncbi:HD domain-containing protein [Nocardia sp. NPDC051570]|uniref:HD domain-containing protein n=1 Tax=Nocardia sp. NPDC051570 TaxID=3364324 RepID=UPI0037AFEB5E